MTPPENHTPKILTRAEAVAMTLLGVDWGRRRIGLAIKPAGQDWTLPQTTLSVAGDAEAVAGLRQAIERAGAQGVVVGLPIHPDPEQAREIRRFCRKTREGTRGVRWFFVDETLTTEAAETLGREALGATLGKNGLPRRPSDDLAAAIILETFIDRCR